ncbi:MAG: YvcK family protein [SAR202 cluster bacterium]|nr:YvcK family protein [SAR202 cluster bacterium]
MTESFKNKTPHIVAIGGGTGLSVLLRGLKQHTRRITAVIGVTDDGGSSGRLRREMGIIPPGDFRNCIVALSDEDSLLKELFQYRFPEGSELQGHSFGNLFIAAMTDVTNSFEDALTESSRILSVTGQVVPATIENVNLSVKLADGRFIKGESKVKESSSEIEELFIDPPDAEASPAAIKAIGEADLIVIGPGSLYTSILPNLMVPGIVDAISESKGIKYYICNVATEIGETQHFNVIKHIDVLERYLGSGILDMTIANDNIDDIGSQFHGEAVDPNTDSTKHLIATSDLLDKEHKVRHDSGKLAKFIMENYLG